MLRNHINTGGCGLSRSSFLCLIVPPNWGKKRPTIEKTNSQKQRRAMLVLFNWPPSKKKTNPQSKKVLLFVLLLVCVEVRHPGNKARTLTVMEQSATHISLCAPIVQNGTRCMFEGVCTFCCSVWSFSCSPHRRTSWRTFLSSWAKCRVSRWMTGLVFIYFIGLHQIRKPLVINIAMAMNKT